MKNPIVRFKEKIETKYSYDNIRMISRIESMFYELRNFGIEERIDNINYQYKEPVKAGYDFIISGLKPAMAIFKIDHIKLINIVEFKRNKIAKELKNCSCYDDKVKKIIEDSFNTLFINLKSDFQQQPNVIDLLDTLCEMGSIMCINGLEYVEGLKKSLLELQSEKEQQRA